MREASPDADAEVVVGAKGAAARRGFTLIEMLISLSIFAVITAFVTANFNAGRQGDELRLASQLTASAIRRAQTAAAAGQTARFCRGGSKDLKVCLTGTDAECGGGICVSEVPHGYGIHFGTSAADARKVYFFADINGDRTYQSGEEIRSDNVSPGAFVSVTGLSVAGSSLDLVFEPPKPTLYINAATSVATAVVTMTHRTTGQTKTVTVNRISGQVSAD